VPHIVSATGAVVVAALEPEASGAEVEPEHPLREIVAAARAVTVRAVKERFIAYSVR